MMKKDRKRTLLKRLEEFFKNDETVEEASLFTKQELKAPMDVLRVLVTDYGAGLNDILAEYSFLPLGEEDEIWYFSGVLTIRMNVPHEGVMPLSVAVSRLNFYLPAGAFAVSADGTTLIYKNVSLIRTDRSDDLIYEDMELLSDTALLIPENFVYSLIEVSQGGLTLKQFLETLPA